MKHGCGCRGARAGADSAPASAAGRTVGDAVRDHRGALEVGDLLEALRAVPA